MAAPLLSRELLDERSSYPIHEEDSVPQGDPHFGQCSYLRSALRRQLPYLRVEADMCLYWQPGSGQPYRAADLAVIGAPEPEGNTVYLAWADGPLLFVAEAASSSTRAEDLTDKFSDYEQLLRAAEYLFFDSDPRESRFWRLEGGRYREVPPDPQRGHWSEQLRLWFAFDADGLMRAYTPEGERLLTYDEYVDLSAEERRRAGEERRRREHEARRADREAHLREREARRADREARPREAETHRADGEARRADEERHLREDMERRLAEALCRLERE